LLLRGEYKARDFFFARVLLQFSLNQSIMIEYLSGRARICGGKVNLLTIF
jgi:hypothetical protein